MWQYKQNFCRMKCIEKEKSEFKIISVPGCFKSVIISSTITSSTVSLVILQGRFRSNYRKTTLSASPSKNEVSLKWNLVAVTMFEESERFNSHPNTHRLNMGS